MPTNSDPLDGALVALATEKPLQGGLEWALEALAISRAETERLKAAGLAVMEGNRAYHVEAIALQSRIGSLEATLRDAREALSAYSRDDLVAKIDATLTPKP